MTTSLYDYSLYLLRMDGTLLGEVSVLPDWGTACQSAVWEGMRTGQLPLQLSLAGQTGIEPVWDWHGANRLPVASAFA